jgi:hypothetical protein
VPVKWHGDDSHDVLIQRAVAAGLRGPFAAGGGFRAVAVPRNNRLEDNLNMAELTAVEVLALSALMEGRPMTSAELSRRVSDMGMHLNSDDAVVTLRSLAGMGMAERTRAASLGKFRITAQGRSWLASRTAPAERSRDKTRS